MKILETLEKLSTQELTQSAERLISEERKNQAQLIAHLAEISRRKVHLDLGYKHLFDYCVRHLGLGEGSTWRRIQVANVCRRFPEILGALAEREINLTVASLVAPHLNEKNVEDLLRTCARKTKREVEKYLVSLAPRETVTAGVRKKSMKPRGTGSPVGVFTPQETRTPTK